jgi:hypothetical protein
MNAILDAFAKELGNKKRATEFPEDMGSKKKVAINLAVQQETKGYYVTPGAFIKVYPKGKKLMMKIQGLKAELIPVAEKNAFIPKLFLFGFVPIRLNKQRLYFEEVDGVKVLSEQESKSPKQLMAVKYQEKKISDVWKDRIGNYEVINKLEKEIDFFEKYNLTIKDDLLIISFKEVNKSQKIEMVLNQINDQRSVIAGLGRYAGQSVKLQNETMTVFGLTLKKIDNEK